MGMVIRPGDINICTFVDLFNLRFGPSEATRRGSRDYGGIAEMAALQREFQIFKEGRPFVTSAALLGLGGLLNSPAKNRWFELLGELPKFASDQPEENGDQRIVNALIANFNKARPLPCLMRAHDGREHGASRVSVVESDAPLFYFNQPQFLMISLPMRPLTQPKPAARRAKR